MMLDPSQYLLEGRAFDATLTGCRPPFGPKASAPLQLRSDEVIGCFAGLGA